MSNPLVRFWRAFFDQDDDRVPDDERCECGYEQPRNAIEVDRAKEIEISTEEIATEDTPVARIRIMQRVFTFRCLYCGETFEVRPPHARTRKVDWKDDQAAEHTDGGVSA